MHINGNDTIGIYIPVKLHRANNHWNWKNDKSVLNTINKSSLLWLCEQSIIQGDMFDPDANGTYVNIELEKINIAQGTPEQLLRVKRFLVDSREAHPERQLKTHAEVIDFAIEQAEKVPSLENEIRELKKQIAEMKGDE